MICQEQYLSLGAAASILVLLCGRRLRLGLCGGTWRHGGESGGLLAAGGRVVALEESRIFILDLEHPEPLTNRSTCIYTGNPQLGACCSIQAPHSFSNSNAKRPLQT